jgi:hypothetical protein
MRPLLVLLSRVKARETAYADLHSVIAADDVNQLFAILTAPFAANAVADAMRIVDRIESATSTAESIIEAN